MVSKGDKDRTVEADKVISELLRRARVQGEITLTEHGEPVGVLASLAGVEGLSRDEGEVDQLMKDFDTLADRYTLAGHSIKAMIEEGRL